MSEGRIRVKAITIRKLQGRMSNAMIQLQGCQQRPWLVGLVSGSYVDLRLFSLDLDSRENVMLRKML